MTETPPRVSAREIADLASWALSLSRAGARSDPAEHAAFLAAKADLLGRIADQRTRRHTEQHANITEGDRQ